MFLIYINAIIKGVNSYTCLIADDAKLMSRREMRIARSFKRATNFITVVKNGD